MISEQDKDALLKAFSILNKTICNNPETALEITIDAYNLAHCGDMGLPLATQITSHITKTINGSW